MGNSGGGGRLKCLFGILNMTAGQCANIHTHTLSLSSRCVNSLRIDLRVPTYIFHLSFFIPLGVCVCPHVHVCLCLIDASRGW